MLCGVEVNIIKKAGRAQKCSLYCAMHAKLSSDVTTIPNFPKLG